MKRFFSRAIRPRPQIPVDTTAPTTPGSLVASLVGQTPHLVWNASTDNVAVTGYQVWRSVSGGAYALLAEIAPATSYDDTSSISPSTLCAYKVLAFDAARNLSAFSNIDSTTTPGNTPDVTAPPTPTGLAGTHTSNTVTMTWNASTDPTVGGAVTSGTKEYVLKRSGTVIATIAAGSPLSYTDTGRSPSTLYSYTIAARDNALNISADSAAVNVTTDATSSDKFPRTAGVFVNGGGAFWTAGAQAFLATRHISMVGLYRGWTGNNGSHPSAKTITQNSMAASTLTNKPRIVNYMIWGDIAKAPGSPTAPVGNGPWENYCINNNWLLYANGLAPSTATAVTSTFQPSNFYHCNTSTYTPVVAGKRSWEYFVDFVFGWQVGGSDPTSGDPANPIDRAAGNAGVFCDACILYIDKAGDWNVNGSSDPAHVSHVDQAQDQWPRDGQASYLRYVRTKYGGNAFIVINAGYPMDVYKFPSVSGLTGGLADAALCESAIGRSSGSEDDYGGSDYVMQGYVNTELIAPAIIHHDGFINSTTGQDALSTFRGDPNFQAERYGQALTAMRNGYYANTIEQNYKIDSAWNTDEFDGGGHLGFEWLGDPSPGAAGAVQTAATQNGIWRRDFVNGIVLYLPRTSQFHTATVDTTSRAITLGGTFYRLRGVRDTTNNNAAAVTSVTFTRDRNGLFLSRTPT